MCHAGGGGGGGGGGGVVKEKTYRSEVHVLVSMHLRIHKFSVNTSINYFNAGIVFQWIRAVAEKSIESCQFVIMESQEKIGQFSHVARVPNRCCLLMRK